MTRATGTSRVTPPSSNGHSSVEEMEVSWDDLMSFNRKERRHLADRFDAEFMDLHLYIMQTLSPTEVQPEDDDTEFRKIQKIVSVDGKRVTVDEIIVEMLYLIRLRTDPEASLDDFDDFSYMDLIGLVKAPKDGTSTESTDN